ncbi:hypothetical protein JCM8547_007137 [Rhodosporidiobolus lusitaniae]
MSSSSAVQTQLESAYKSTLAQLARVLAFQGRLQQQGGAGYVTQPPRQLTEQLHAEAAKFDAVCEHVEQRVLRALAVLERDARKAAGISPLPVPASAPPPQPPAQPAAPIEPVAQPATNNSLDLTSSPPLPFSLPVSTASSAPLPSAVAPAHSAPMELDLTLSPSPPPSAAKKAATTDDAPLPFQLPVSTASSSSNSPFAAPSSAPAQPPPPAAAPGLPGDEDIHALLSSLNMPPFDLASSTSSSVAAPASTAASASIANPSASALPDLSMEDLAALLNTTTSSAPPPPPAPASAPLDLFGLGPSSSMPSDPTGGSGGIGAFDYTSLLSSSGGVGGDATGAGAGAGAGGGGGVPDLSDLDFSGLGAGGFDMSQFATGMGAEGQPSLDELLKNLG